MMIVRDGTMKTPTMLAMMDDDDDGEV